MEAARKEARPGTQRALLGLGVGALAVSLIPSLSNSSLSAKASDRLHYFLRALSFPSVRKGNWKGFGFSCLDLKKEKILLIYIHIKIDVCVCVCTDTYVYIFCAYTHTFF